MTEFLAKTLIIACRTVWCIGMLVLSLFGFVYVVELLPWQVVAGLAVPIALLTVFYLVVMLRLDDLRGNDRATIMEENRMVFSLPLLVVAFVQVIYWLKWPKRSEDPE